MKNTKKATNKTTKRIPKGEQPLPTAFLRQSKTFFLTYKGISDSGQKLTKQSLANFLLHTNPNDRTVKPEKYLICQQMYDSGQPHFHAILIYPKRKSVENPHHYDYLNIHPNIQTMRNLKAALEYVYKQDPNPYTNMNIVQQRRVARAKDSSSLYQLLQQQMLKDPIKFNLNKYCYQHNLFKQIYKANFTKAFQLLKCAQQAAAGAVMSDKPGIKLITPELIKQNLQAPQLEQFYSHPCYQKIVAHINQIYYYPNRSQSSMAPSKTPHLLLVGDSSIGKSALVDHRSNEQFPYPGLMHYYACYHMFVGQRFLPPYKSFLFPMVRWNQFVIESDAFPKKSYNRLLDYLEGAPSALPQKGRPAAPRHDNPKHILTSNRTLQQHICKTFKSQQSRSLARMNLGTRIDCVSIPKGKNIHFLRKLFVAVAL